MNNEAYNAGYTQTMMQAKVFGIEYAQTCYHAEQRNAYKRYIGTGDSLASARQWVDGGLSALLDFNNQSEA
jgi:hypothetical protein